MDELTVVLRARQFLRETDVNSIPVDVESLAAAANATIKVVHNLEDDESGQTFPFGDKHIIAVNGNQREERQRFTVLHEVAHIVLELPSQHHGASMTTADVVSYRRRPKEEILCDVFASECLLPYQRFRNDVEDVDVSLDAVKNLAELYKASVTSTGSRFAVNCLIPCAFVLIERGKIRYVSSSNHLRELKGWIEYGVATPHGSVAHDLSKPDCTKIQDYDEIASDIWFQDGLRNHMLVAEESMFLRDWDQCLSLIWIDESLRPASGENNYQANDDEPLLDELDGVLPWPSNRKRK